MPNTHYRTGSAIFLHPALRFVFRGTWRVGNASNLPLSRPACRLVSTARDGHLRAHSSAALPADEVHGVLAPRAKLRPRIVPKLPESVWPAGACTIKPASDKPKHQPRERPPPRDRTDPVVPQGMPVFATALARRLDGADVPTPNVLSAKHLARIKGGLLFAATSRVPCATLLARKSRASRAGLRWARRYHRDGWWSSCLRPRSASRREPDTSCRLEARASSSAMMLRR